MQVYVEDLIAESSQFVQHSHKSDTQKTSLCKWKIPKFAESVRDETFFSDSPPLSSSFSWHLIQHSVKRLKNVPSLQEYSRLSPFLQRRLHSAALNLAHTQKCTLKNSSSYELLLLSTIVALCCEGLSWRKMRKAKKKEENKSPYIHNLSSSSPIRLKGPSSGEKHHRDRRLELSQSDESLVSIWGIFTWV